MKYTKILTFALGIAITVGSLFMAGCHDETKNFDKCLKFARYSGTTVGYLVNASTATLGPEVRDTVATATMAIVTELPTNITAETIAADLRTISTNAISVAIPEVYEKYPELVASTINTLLNLLQTGLVSIREKYPVEFDNTEMFYKIAYAFFDSVNVIVVPAANREATPSNGPLSVVQVKYEDIAAVAKIDGNKILSKEDFETFMAILSKRN